MPISILRTSDGKLDQANQLDFDDLAGRLAANRRK
ncbi:hypothetical protein ABIF64_003843 [Bradyrhizobium japonicum]